MLAYVAWTDHRGQDVIGREWTAAGHNQGFRTQLKPFPAYLPPSTAPPPSSGDRTKCALLRTVLRCEHSTVQY